MAKIKKIEHLHEGKKWMHDQYHYMCPGCGYIHAFALKTEGGHHTWNNDYEKPTVTPSLVQNFTPGVICHSQITNGIISYYKDSIHALSGKSVELPEII